MKSWLRTIRFELSRIRWLKLVIVGCLLYPAVLALDTPIWAGILWFVAVLWFSGLRKPEHWS